MTMIFLPVIVVTIAVVGSLSFVLMAHVRRQDETKKLSATDDSGTESIDDAEAGFDWKRAA